METNMAKEAIIMTVDEFLKQYGNKAFEAFTRQKNGKYKAFSKIILKGDNKEAIETIKIAVMKANQNIEKINKITTDITKAMNINNYIGGLNVFLNAANLCATAAGFVIVYKELNEVKTRINEVKEALLDTHEQEVFKDFDNVIDDYSDMLDSKKIDKEYSEDQYRELIKNEYSMIKLLIKMFTKSTCNNKHDVLYAIMSLSSMLACTLVNFDEVYYYNNKEKQKWHLSHEKWMSIYDNLTSSDFIRSLEDYMFIEQNYNQYQTDMFVRSIIDSFSQSKQAIIDRQTLIQLKDSRNDYIDIIKNINQSVINDIDESINEIGLSDNVLVQNAVKESKQILELYS